MHFFAFCSFHDLEPFPNYISFIDVKKNKEIINHLELMLTKYFTV